jgi:hypothetical protein
VFSTPNSYKLDTGVQIYVTLLIGAVLVLSLVVLAEKGVLPSKDMGVLGVVQLGLFAHAMGSTLSIASAEELSI